MLSADKFLDMKDQLRFMEKSPLFKGTAKPIYRNIEIYRLQWGSKV